PVFARPPDSEPVDHEEPSTRVYSRSASNHKRWAAGTALLVVAAALALVVVLAAGSGSGGSSPTANRSSRTAATGGPGQGAADQEAGASGGASAATEAEAGSGAQGESGGSTETGPPPRQATEAPVPAVPEPTGNDPARGSALNQEGFALIQAGSYEEAVPILEEAVRAFPAGTEEIEYAYALFNLGDALRRSGRPEAAIPVLERRLEIPNQTDVVERELAAARSESESAAGVESVTGGE
ncbi:MAG TPA: tetratricopeptide repeat protein, partial [Solirubrobacterales bacterium]|nr:tetratricopeptide repeat protein [Solirubrobacterales bacterium]